MRRAHELHLLLGKGISAIHDRHQEPLSVLRDAVRHALRQSTRRNSGGRRGLPGERGRAVHQGLDGGRAARASRAADDAAGPRRGRAPRARRAGTRRSTAIARAASAALQAAHGRDAVGVFGSGALTNEKAYLLGKFARVALGTAEHRLQRPLLHVVRGGGRRTARSASIAGCRSRVADIAEAEADPARRRNVAETHAAGHAVLRRSSGARGGALIVVDPRRTADRRGGDLHLPLTPGTDARARQRAAARRSSARAWSTTTYIARARPASTRVRAAVGRATGPAASSASPACPRRRSSQRRAPARPTRARAMVLTGRGAEQQAQGVDNALALHQPRAGARAGRARRRRLRLPDRAGQRPGRPRARPEGRPAPRLPPHRRPAARAHVAAVWGVDRGRAAAARARRAYETARRARRARRRPRAARHRLEPGGLGAARGPHRSERLARARLPGGVRLLPVRDRGARRRRAAGRAVGRGGGHDHQPRRPRDPAPRARRAPPAGVRTDLDVLRELAARLGRRRAASRSPTPRAVFEELRARHAPAAPPTTRHQPTTRLDARGRRLLALPRRATTRARRACSPSGFPTAGRPRALPRGAADSRRPRRPTRVPALPHHRPLLAQYQSGTQTRRVARARRARARCRVVEVHPLTRAPARHRRRRPRRRRDAARRARRSARRVTSDIRAGHLFVPFHWGGLGSANLLTNPALDPTSRMPEFKVCAARIVRRERGAPRRRRAGAPYDDERQHWSSSATAWRAPGSSRRCSRRGGDPRFDDHDVRRRALRQLQPHPAVGRARRRARPEDIFINPLDWYARARRDAARRRAASTRIDRARARASTRERRSREPYDDARASPPAACPSSRRSRAARATDGDADRPASTCSARSMTAHDDRARTRSVARAPP